MKLRINSLIALSVMVGAVALAGCDQSGNTTKETTTTTTSTNSAMTGPKSDAPASGTMAPAPDSTNSTTTTTTNSTNTPQ